MSIQIITPQGFEPENHFYPKALNSQMHAVVDYFLSLTPERIIERYTHLNPGVDKAFLESILNYKTKYFYWGGADLFHVTTETGERKVIVIETNSCPSGQKSMPIMHSSDEYRGYKKLIEESFVVEMKQRNLPSGKVAVVYDKNFMEVSGYAHVVADTINEDIFLVDINHHQLIVSEEGLLGITIEDKVIFFRAIFKYMTQKPWSHIPLSSKTFVFNAMVACLAGGRNKMLASKSYDFFNAEIFQSGLKINTPETIRDVHKMEIPLWVSKFGGFAVIKNPYSNAGQGVYTITNKDELDAFMGLEHEYEKFIVQNLIGHHEWSSIVNNQKYFHVGTFPNKKNNIYVFDLRMMVYSGINGFRPCAIYARKAKRPLKSSIDADDCSWDVLGTNLSYKEGGNWTTETKRLLLMDRKDFNYTGLGVDDLIESYIQSVLSVIAIDKMAQRLMTNKNKFRFKLFKSLNSDDVLMNEIIRDRK